MVDWKRVNFGIGVMGIVMLFLHAFDAIVNGAVIGGLLPNSALKGKARLLTK